jgi:hypothetical protein
MLVIWAACFPDHSLSGETTMSAGRLENETRIDELDVTVRTSELLILALGDRCGTVGDLRKTFAQTRLSLRNGPSRIKLRGIGQRRLDEIRRILPEIVADDAHDAGTLH